MLVCWVAVCRWWQHLKLVRHHVAQALIDVANKDVCLQLLSIDTTVHSLVAMVIVTTCAVRCILHFVHTLLSTIS